MSERDKPLAALSVDMDDLWSYLKTAGDESWREHPSFMSMAMPRLFDMLGEFRMGITCFVIGDDVERPSVRPWLERFVDSGHELANHSSTHNAALASADVASMEAELAACEQAVEQAFGVRLLGYRGPSFSYSPALLQLLAQRGYLYDSSTFPTYLGPLGRLYHRIASRKRGGQGAGSEHLFGGLREALRPLKPYRWKLQDQSLLELPTTTMPFLRLPMHGTYLQFLADFSETLAMAYFRFALALCRMSRTPPVFLLHASDFLGCDDLEQASVIPGMRRRAEAKLGFMRRVFLELNKHYRVVGMGELAAGYAHVPLSLHTPR